MTSTAIPARPAARRSLPHLLFVAGVALALSHTLESFFDLGPVGQPAWKASGIVLLGLYAFASRAPLVGLALLLSAVGDVALELTPPSMVGGMAAFGLAHVVYAVCFLRATNTDNVAPRGRLLAGIVFAVTCGLLVWFMEGMAREQLVLPGLGYQFIITVMVVLAMVSRAPLWARVGAVLFMVSDMLIAFTLYREIGTPAGSVWITYALAQILLARGLVSRKA